MMSAVNGTPALSAADVGIAISNGAQLAREINEAVRNAFQVKKVASSHTKKQ